MTPDASINYMLSGSFSHYVSFVTSLIFLVISLSYKQIKHQTFFLGGRSIFLVWPNWATDLFYTTTPSGVLLHFSKPVLIIC